MFGGSWPGLLFGDGLPFGGSFSVVAPGVLLGSPWFVGLRSLMVGFLAGSGEGEEASSRRC